MRKFKVTLDFTGFEEPKKKLPPGEVVLTEDELRTKLDWPKEMQLAPRGWSPRLEFLVGYWWDYFSGSWEEIIGGRLG
jgi:hypothetical protein